MARQPTSNEVVLIVTVENPVGGDVRVINSKDITPAGGYIFDKDYFGAQIRFDSNDGYRIYRDPSLPYSTSIFNDGVLLMDQNYDLSFSFIPDFYLTTEVQLIGEGSNPGTITPISGWQIPNTTVTVQAVVNSGYKIVGWEGTVNNNIIYSTNAVFMDSSKTVSVKMEKNPDTIPYTHSLITKVKYDTGGSISPPTQPFVAGTLVTLTATPDSGFKVVGWEGTNNDSSLSNINQVYMGEEDTIVSVHFGEDSTSIPPPTLGLTTTPQKLQGQLEPKGTISPLGYTSYPQGTTVQLIAIPDEGYQVSYWRGTNNDSSKSNINAITMDTYERVDVAFEEIPIESSLYNVAVNCIGGGDSRISIEEFRLVVEGVSWGRDFTASFAEPISITLNATSIPTNTYKIKKWIVDGITLPSSSNIVISLTGNNFVTVEFEEGSNQYTLDFSITGAYGGTVNHDGITTWDAGVIPTLIVTPPYAGNWSANWVGTDSDNIIALTNSVHMDQNRTVVVSLNTEDGPPPPPPPPPPETTYELTTSVGSECGGSITPSGTTTQIANSTVHLIAIPPEGSGWTVESWSGTNNDSSTSFQNDITITSNRSVVVKFFHSDFYLATSVSSGDGVISPDSGYQKAGTVVTLYAEPDDNCQVSGWGGDATNSTSVVNTVTMCADKTVSVSFSETAPGATVTLSTNVIGYGAISPASGTYYQHTKVTCKAIPSYGYTFAGWINIDSDMKVTGIGGIELEVTMSENKLITAQFEMTPSFEEVESTTFYCPSTEYKNNIISFNYKNTLDPSAEKRFHFRISFYHDIDKNYFVYSAFSLLDQKRWYIDNGTTISQIPADGISLPLGETVNIVYDPEISPSELIEHQLWHKINTNNFLEKTLVCGVQYLVDVESYDDITSSLNLLETLNFITSCEDVQDHYWREDLDKKNWICSGQGKNDLKISDTGEQSIFSSIDSNIHGNFFIVWQSMRQNNNPVLGATWDSEADKLYCSGQALFDTKYLSHGFRPKVIVDQAQNNYVSGFIQNQIYSYKCAMKVSNKEDFEETTVSFDEICYPGYSQNLDSTIGNFKIRVYEDDVTNSIVINENKSLSVVEKSNIKLDIIGISGAYAVRLRNSDNQYWSDWINIDTNLYATTNQPITETDTTYDAYFIKNDRFITPWKLPSINGIRRICCQILTSYGITRTFCLDIFVNFPTLDYKVEFYWDDQLSIPMPIYNGYPIVSELKNSEGTPIADITTVYIKVIFSSNISYENLMFNAIQQGTADQYNLPLVKISTNEGIYKGAFLVYKDDGIFNKDGYSFINVIFPDDIVNVSTGCKSDSSDKYNLMINQNELFKYNDQDPTVVFQEYKTSKINKVTNIKSLKQYYNIDDNNFIFGNPKFYIDKNDL